jgi:hypothetical protein
VRTRRSTQRRRLVAAVLAALIVPIAGGAPSAHAVPADIHYQRPAGDTPSEFGHTVARASKPGDTKFDSPGASRAPQYDAPRTIELVRPARTIVRDTDPVLPIALSGAALLVALGLAGTALVRTRSPRLS